MTENPSLFGLQWPAAARREIRLNVIMLHGDEFESFSETRLTFPDSPEGHARAQFAMNALPFITRAAENRRSRAMTGYDICIAAGEEMSVPAAALNELFSSMFCRDARYRTYLALPIAYTLERHTESGIQRAAFPYGAKGLKRNFQLIAKALNFDPQALRHWA